MEAHRGWSTLPSPPTVPAWISGPVAGRCAGPGSASCGSACGVHRPLFTPGTTVVLRVTGGVELQVHCLPSGLALLSSALCALGGFLSNVQSRWPGVAEAMCGGPLTPRRPLPVPLAAQEEAEGQKNWLSGSPLTDILQDSSS